MGTLGYDWNDWNVPHCADAMLMMTEAYERLVQDEQAIGYPNEVHKWASLPEDLTPCVESLLINLGKSMDRSIIKEACSYNRAHEDTKHKDAGA